MNPFPAIFPVPGKHIGIPGKGLPAFTGAKPVGLPFPHEGVTKWLYTWLLPADGIIGKNRFKLVGQSVSFHCDHLLLWIPLAGETLSPDSRNRVPYHRMVETHSSSHELRLNFYDTEAKKMPEEAAR